jgi:hypothetical protein
MEKVGGHYSHPIFFNNIGVADISEFLITSHYHLVIIGKINGGV